MSPTVPATEENIRRAAALLAAGELVCFPTETVYGVGANAADAGAVARIFEAKGRPADHPLIVHLPDAAAMTSWAADVPEAAWTLAGRFWPGPLTVVLRRGREVPPVVTGGQDTVALRVPAHPVARRLLEAFAGGLAAPSANRFGRISPTRAEHAEAELGGSVALVLDGGPCEVGVESTIVDLSSGVPLLLRPGGVARRALEDALGSSVADAPAREGPRAPGRLAKHYAPASPVELLGRDELDARLGEPAVAVLARRPVPRGFEGRWISLPGDAEGYARGLYSALRDLDGRGGRILVETPPDDQAWEAVRDRLLRAAAGSGGTRSEEGT